MIRFNLSKLLEKLEAKEGHRITLKELSERSGCDRNVLSRMLNRPDIVPSAGAIDKLVQFFFFEITRDDEKPHLDRNRIKSVIKDFVLVFPDNDEFWAGIPSELRDNPSVSLDTIWQLYTKDQNSKRVKPDQKLEVRNSLKAKLLEAESIKLQGGDIELSLSAEELDLLRDQLPKNMGGTKEN
jgi:transcriptional regulator with XRE-family HTH domain